MQTNDRAPIRGNEHMFASEGEETEQLNLRDRTLVSVLAYSGPRPEEVVCRLARSDVGEQAIRYVDTKRHRTRFNPLLPPLAEDLGEWFAASGRPAPRQPVFPAHDGDFWDQDDWRNWRQRVWRSDPNRPRPERPSGTPARRGCAPEGTRPRDLRSSYITVRLRGRAAHSGRARSRNQRSHDRGAFTRA
jgi:integrase